MAEEDQTTFAKAVAHEFPYGSELVGIVLDLTLNHKTWKKTPYLYACLLGWNEGDYTLCDDSSFCMGMELLLYTCVTKVVQDKHLLQKVCQIFVFASQHLFLKNPSSSWTTTEVIISSS